MKSVTRDALEQRIKELEQEVVELQKEKEAIHEDERLFRLFVENSTDGLILHDLDGRIIDVNQRTCDNLGYTREELLTMSIKDIDQDFDAGGHSEEWAQMVPGVPILLEGFVLRKDGATFPTEVHLVAFDSGGRRLILAQSRDITQSKQAEENLELLEKLVNQANDLILMIHSDSGRIFYVNKKMRTELGYTQNELMKMKTPDIDLAVLDMSEMYKKVIKRLEKEGSISFETIYKRKDSTTFPVEVNIDTIIHVGQRYNIAVVRNIEERKRAEELLRRSEERYRTLVESMGLGVVLVDCDHNIMMVNAEIGRWFNKAPSSFAGKKCFRELEKRDAVCPHCPGIQAMATGKTAVVETEGMGDDGSRINVRNHAFPTYGQDGTLTGFIEISENITEVRQLQAQLQRAQKMEAIGTLAGGVAHDLNNILSGIVTYPELLLMEIPEESPLRKPLVSIQKSGERAANIVQDLLTLARRGVAVRDVVNLNHIISEYIRSPEHEKLKLLHPEVQLETDLETDLLNIIGSPIHLSKTIMNLISNAAEALPHGGKISISTENRYIDRPIRGYDNIEEGDYVALIVSDNGVGISSEDIERIFEPFYTKKVMGKSGTGLGMAVVWGTVKDHKGYIDIQSTQGKGSTFALYFPVTRKELAKDESSLSVEDYAGKGETILVVDDMKDQREVAAGILDKLGYSVTSVSSGEEAFNYMKSNSVDLLVLDMVMDPGMDGLETYKKILEFHPGQKAIIVSGFSETDRVKEVQRLGAGDYIKKPYLLEKIGLAIRAELDRE